MNLNSSRLRGGGSETVSPVLVVPGRVHLALKCVTVGCRRVEIILIDPEVLATDQ